MSLINIVPNLTSNNFTNPITGGKIKISASVNESPTNVNFTAYKSFVSTAGYWSGNIVNDWLQIDFGEEKGLSTIQFYKPDGVPFFTEAQILGSLDGQIFDVITDVVSEITTSNGKMFVNLNKVIKYRYYRFLTVSGAACFGKITLMIDDDLFINECVSSSNSSLVYTLPMNTTSNILAKTNDLREGLLGMANDNENYGDLYVVGKDGKSHLTKSGMKSEIIFEGSANKVDEIYNLAKDMSLFKQIVFFSTGEYQGQKRGYVSITINIEDINEYKTKYALVISNIYKNNENEASILFHIVNETQFQIDQLYSKTWSNKGITKVIGIY